MARDLVARYSLIDALGICLILYCMNEVTFFLAEVVFIAACLRRLWPHPHMKFFWAVVAVFMLLMRPRPQMFPVMHFFSTTIVSTVVTGHRKGPTQLLLSQGIVVLFAYTERATNLLYGSHAPSLVELLDLSIVPHNHWLDRFPYISRYSVPVLATFLGIFFLVDAEGRKARQPWIWKLAAHIRIAMIDPLRRQRRAHPLEYKVRYVQDHLMGLIVNRQAKDLVVTVDAVEWTQVWTQDSLLIIYGLSPQVDYAACIRDAATGSYCELIISTNVPEKVASNNNGVRRQTPMTTLFEAQRIAVSTLAEEKAKFKRQRKENNKILAHLRNEMDAVPAKHSRTTKSDERLIRKAMGLQESIKQLQEEIKEIQHANSELELSKPEHDSQHAQNQDRYFEELETLESQIEAVNTKIKEMRESEDNKKHDIVRLEQRKTKITEKLAKVKEETAAVRKSTDQNISGIISKRKNARSIMNRRRATQKTEFETSIRKLEQSFLDLTARTRLIEEARSSW